MSEQLQAQLDAVTATLRQAEAKIVELAAYGEKRYQQWQDAKALAERARVRGRAISRQNFDLRAQRNGAQSRAEVAEKLLDSLADMVVKDAKTRGDADMRSVEIAAAHIRNQVEGYKIHRDHGHTADTCPIEAAQPNTKEQNVAFRKAWDARYEAGQKRKEETPSCPRCYEDVEHEDDHLQGDKDVNCWYECPGDERPVA